MYQNSTPFTLQAQFPQVTDKFLDASGCPANVIWRTDNNYPKIIHTVEIYIAQLTITVSNLACWFIPSAIISAAIRVFPNFDS